MKYFNIKQFYETCIEDDLILIDSWKENCFDCGYCWLTPNEKLFLYLWRSGEISIKYWIKGRIY